MKTSLLSLMLGFLLCLAGSAEAQKVYRIGALMANDQFVPAFEGFRRKMAELGYVEGKNTNYDFHNAKGNLDALKKLAQKIVQGKPDLIVTSSTSATIAVSKLTEGTDLPVVFLFSGNPLKLVKSYASSGNNLTGISSSILDLTEKQLELFKELAPRVSRVILIRNQRGVNYEDYAILTRKAASRVGLTVVEIEFRATNADEVKKQLFLITRKSGDGLLIPPDATLEGASESIAQQAIKEKLVTVGPNVQGVRRGFLAGYSSEYYALGQQGAVLVDKILKGARPTDLPIEQAYKLRLVINLKTARAIDLKIPKEILLRADEVIE
jgi:putative ABC transport system substrate-binding protein